MVHLYVAVRGQADWINRWENDLCAEYFDYKYGGVTDWKGTAQPMVGKLQCGVRPIRLYEVVFPKEVTEQALAKINPTVSWNSKYDKYISWIRKILGSNPIPEFKQGFPLQSRRFVDVTGIGMKEDNDIIIKVENL